MTADVLIQMYFIIGMALALHRMAGFLVYIANRNEHLFVDAAQHPAVAAIVALVAAVILVSCYAILMTLWPAMLFYAWRKKKPNS